MQITDRATLFPSKFSLTADVDQNAKTDEAVHSRRLFSPSESDILTRLFTSMKKTDY